MKREDIKKIAEENFKRWNKALQTRNPRKVAELYSDEIFFFQL